MKSENLIFFIGGLVLVGGGVAIYYVLKDDKKVQVKTKEAGPYNITPISYSPVYGSTAPSSSSNTTNLKEAGQSLADLFGNKKDKAATVKEPKERKEKTGKSIGDLFSGWFAKKPTNEEKTTFVYVEPPKIKEKITVPDYGGGYTQTDASTYAFTK